MSKVKLLSIIAIICILIGAGIALASSVQGESANNSLDDFYSDLLETNGTFNLEKDYKFQGNASEQPIGGLDLIINGNGHTIDGSKISSGFYINNFGNDINVVINNLTFSNFNGPIVSSEFTDLTLNNVTIIDNSNGSDWHGLITVLDSNNVTLNNCTFKSNSNCSAVYIIDSVVTINGSTIEDCDNFSAIVQDRGSLEIDNTDIRNCRCDYGGMLNFKGDYLSIRNSNFTNSRDSITGGAIVGKYFPNDINKELVSSDEMTIENCIFSRLSSSSNGGAINMDLDSGSSYIPQTLNIVNCSFTDCSSKFGGAIVDLGGNVNIKDSILENNLARSTGGAIYTSWANLTIDNSTLSNNAAKNASAIYFDYGKFDIRDSNLSDNKAISADGGNLVGLLLNNLSSDSGGNLAGLPKNNLSSDSGGNLAGLPKNKLSTEPNGNVIYANDAKINFANSTFDNDGLIYGNFINKSKTENLNLTDRISLNNTDYVVSVENKGIKLDLKNDSINTGKLPSYYDSRDYGWSSPLKHQGDNMACWAFASIGAMECSLLRSTGVLYNLSDNNMQNLQLRYNPLGDTRNNITGFAYSGLGYALSWQGLVMSQDDPYDERGMISEVVESDSRIHLQDAKIIFGGKNDTESSIKQAIMEHGGVSIQFTVGDFNYTYNDKVKQPTHFVCLIGWNDSIPANNFIDLDDNDKSPSKPGGWIIKDSEGLDVGDNGYDYVSYYDKSFLANDSYAIMPQAAAVAYLFENTEDYHVNYQTDLIGLAGFDENYSYYSNEFTSKYNESIGAVGTYFNDSGIDYSFDVYVNGEKVHSQEGESEFAGFRTIPLEKYVPVKEGDKFKVVFKSNALPYQAFSRQHYIEGMSLASSDGESWSDISLENRTVCLKVYTVADDAI